jgi:hypothetical protein
MSLDVYLSMKGAAQKHGAGIFIREGGATKELTRAEWDERFPDREPVVVMGSESDDEVYSANITHNLNTMADAAGIYYHLWRPEELGITKASQLIEPLRTGLQLLQSDPERFKTYNPSNGWGSYEGLVSFVSKYLAACGQYPDADVRACR